MSSFFERHPESDLVRYLDGELPAGRKSFVACHLEFCGRCRAELESLQETLAECALYREEASAQTPAPWPWRDLYRDFSRIDASLANTSLLGRLIRSLGHSGAPRWAFLTGLAALIVVFSLNQLRQAPSVQAASILRKAVAVSEAKPRPAHRIRVRTSRQEFTRLSGAQAAVLQAAEFQTVAALFAAAHYDWNDPLSARAFEQWRDRQVHKSDEVSPVTEPDAPSAHFTRIRTVSENGELESASITFNTDEDYTPVEERLEFRDREWVEMSEIAEASTESAGITGARHVEVPVRAAEPPSRPAAFTPGSPASISDELQVLEALDAIGADLGEQVEVSLNEGKVKVTGGEGIPPGRQEEIRASLSNLPHVEVAFAPAHAVAIPPETVATHGGAVSTPASPFEARLEKQLGGHAEFDRFSTQVLDMDEAAMQRVYALRQLAQRFPADREAQLSAQDSNSLHELSRKHIAVLAEKVSGMERLLDSPLSSLGATAGATRATDRAGWQAASEDTYRSARRVEVLLSQLFGMTPEKASAGTLPSDLMSAMKELQADVDDCQKFLK